MARYDYARGLRGVGSTQLLNKEVNMNAEIIKDEAELVDATTVFDGDFLVGMAYNIATAMKKYLRDNAGNVPAKMG